MAGAARRFNGWGTLGLFWVVLLLLLAAGAAALQLAGPPRMAPEIATEHPAPLAETAAPATDPAAAPIGVPIAAPIAALLEPSKAFPPAVLPKAAADGRVARIVYARAFDQSDTRPRIALVMTGLGMSEADSRAAIQTLPGAVSLSFSPYAGNIEALLDLSRKAGHEMLVSVPLEPQGYPLNDAGSRSLLTGATPQQNAANLEWVLGRFAGYVGAIGALDGMRGERFAEQTSLLKVLQDDVTRRGLLYVDPRPGRTGKPDAPVRGIDLVVDDPPARAEIEAKLAALERLAREKGSAVGLAGPLRPVTVERVAAWARSLSERGIALAPISAVTSGAGR